MTSAFHRLLELAVAVPSEAFRRVSDQASAVPDQSLHYTLDIVPNEGSCVVELREEMNRDGVLCLIKITHRHADHLQLPHWASFQIPFVLVYRQNPDSTLPACVHMRIHVTSRCRTQRNITATQTSKPFPCYYEKDGQICFLISRPPLPSQLNTKRKRPSLSPQG